MEYMGQRIAEIRCLNLAAMDIMADGRLQKVLGSVEEIRAKAVDLKDPYTQTVKKLAET